MTTTSTTSTKKHTGSCHCGDVKYAVEIDASSGTRCNCTICTKVSMTGGIVKPEAFELLTDRANVSSYKFGAVGTRYFCKRCGVHVYGDGFLEQIGGAFVSVYLNTLDDIDLSEVKLGYWDGRHNNWQAGMRETPWPSK
jgi:hypothetical protein